MRHIQQPYDMAPTLLANRAAFGCGVPSSYSLINDGLTERGQVEKKDG